VELLVKAIALGVDHLLRFVLPRRQGEHHLEEELIALMLRSHRAGEPRAEGLSARRGDGVGALLRPGRLAQGLHSHQAGFLEAGQGRVDLGGLDVPIGFAADDGLEGAAQLVAVPRALEQQSERGVAERHR